jgi:competence protein ComEC
MCLIQPLLLKDASFQLSFAASFGLVVFAQPMQDWLNGLLEKKTSEKTAAKWTKPLSEYFLFTLAAQFATMPFIAINFGRLSISSLLANPLVLPVQPAVMVSGGLTLMAGMLHPLAGKLLMLFSWPFIKYTNVMVTLLAKIKGGVLTIHPAFIIWVFVVVAIIVILFFLRDKLARFFQSSRFIWVLLLLAAAGFSTWSIASGQADGLLHLHLVRCNDKATVYLVTPNGKTLALDPRGSMDEFTSSLEKDLSPWSFHLNSVLVTDRKVSEPLAELSGAIDIRQVLLAPSSYRAEEDSKPLTIPDGIAVEKLLPGESVEIEPGVWLTLAAEDLNGTALLMQYGSLRVLMPNGVDFSEIKSSSPGALSGLTAIVLSAEDVRYIPPRVWRNLNPQLILWRDRGISPFENSLGMDVSTEVQLISTGTETWLEK